MGVEISQAEDHYEEEKLSIKQCFLDRKLIMKGYSESEQIYILE